MSDDGTFTIVARARRNANERAGGWLPIIVVDGHERGNTWAARAYDRDEALTLARAFARAERARYVGDWNITIVEEADP